MKKPELLAPAGDWEKLQMAVRFGADAVYLAAGDLSLRAQARNFPTPEALAQAVEYAHAQGVRVYLTLNVYAREDQLAAARSLLRQAAALPVDAFIISDPGIFQLAGQVAPQIPRHISTQAASSNSEAVRFWQQLGAARVILAREVTLAECAQIARAVNLEVEIFVHGAMCMAYSGRCLLSAFLTGRSANQGDCTQPCRWQYRLEEAKRPGAYLPIEEDAAGSYIFNSKDLCLLELLPEVLAADVASLKIEGRNKSAYYTANVTRVYRLALEACWRACVAAQWWYGPQPTAQQIREFYRPDPEWQEELAKVSHRQYCTGFALGQPDSGAYVYDSSYSRRVYDFAAVALAYDGAAGRLLIEQRNHLQIGDQVEIIQPGESRVLSLPVTAIWDEAGQPRSSLPHAQEKAWLACGQPVAAGSVLRRLARGQE